MYFNIIYKHIINIIEKLLHKHNYIKINVEKLNNNFPYYLRRFTHKCIICNKIKITERNGTEGMGDHV